MFNISPVPPSGINNPSLLIYTTTAVSIASSPIKLTVNDKQIQHLVSDVNPIDVTALLRPFGHQNWIVTENEGFFVTYYLIGVWAESITVQQLMDELMSHEHFQFNEVSAICPITRRPIETPARGINCRHPQCFDAIPFITIAQALMQWNCPICGCSMTFDDLCIGWRDGPSDKTLFNGDWEDDIMNCFSDG